MSNEERQFRWRITVGFVLFIASIGWPVLIPILPLLGVSATATTAFSGVMVVAAELILIAGAAVAGKEGFAFIKTSVFGVLSAFGPPREVSQRRYLIGIVMFTIPLVFGWASPYFGHHLPGFASNRWIYAVAFDVLLLLSLLVLGGSFWDKLRSLFQYNAYAIFPDMLSGDGNSRQ